MANATAPLIITTFGVEGYLPDLPVAANTRIFKGSLIAQIAGGLAAPYSSAGGVCVGVAQHDQDNSIGIAGAKRIRIETKRLFGFFNGTAGDAFADTDLLGSPVYGSDDHTVAKVNTGGRSCVGFFLGFEADGKVRVYIDPIAARLVP